MFRSGVFSLHGGGYSRGCGLSSDECGFTPERRGQPKRQLQEWEKSGDRWGHRSDISGGEDSVACQRQVHPGSLKEHETGMVQYVCGSAHLGSHEEHAVPVAGGFANLPLGCHRAKLPEGLDSQRCWFFQTQHLPKVSSFPNPGFS